jgi:hypothetical protein
MAAGFVCAVLHAHATPKHPEKGHRGILSVELEQCAGGCRYYKGAAELLAGVLALGRLVS